MLFFSIFQNSKKTAISNFINCVLLRRKNMYMYKLVITYLITVLLPIPPYNYIDNPWQSYPWRIFFYKKMRQFNGYEHPTKPPSSIGQLWPSFCLVFTQEHLLLSATCVFKGNAVVQKNWNACRMPKIIVGRQSGSPWPYQREET